MAKNISAILIREIDRLRRQFNNLNNVFFPDFRADGLAVKDKNLGFIDDPSFNAAWEKAVAGSLAGWNGQVPDIRWRAHLACWAARHGLELEGDFVECGVYTGLLSQTICHFLDFNRTNKAFYLFDTFKGMPVERMSGRERAMAERGNAYLYRPSLEIAQSNFAAFPNAHIVQGLLPDSLAMAPLSRISYLSVDLNFAEAERQVMEALWDKLVPSAIVVIDDYAFRDHSEQYAMWNTFAASVGRMIFTCPTGQGLLIR